MYSNYKLLVYTGKSYDVPVYLIPILNSLCISFILFTLRGLIELFFLNYSTMIYGRKQIIRKGISRGWAPCPLPIEKLFQIFRLNFS